MTESPTTLVDAKPILVVGHSHAKALLDNMREHGGPPTSGEVSLRPLDAHNAIWGLAGPGLDDRATMFNKAIEMAEGRSVALLWDGNQHSSLFLVEQPVPFDLAPRGLEHLPLQDGAVIVPEAVVRARFRGTLGLLYPLVSAIQSRPDSALTLVGTPPPKRGEGLRALALNEGVFFAGPTGLRLTPPSIMLKLWFVLQDVYREVASEVGIRFVPAPESTRDEDGFLKEEFWAADATHANAEYGRVMISHLAQSLRGSQPPVVVSC
jgi:hypothetical protein